MRTMQARWGLGAVMVAAGCATWAWVASLASPVDNANTPISGAGELELLVRDLRLAPLTLVVVGVVLVASPRLRSWWMAVGVALGTATAVELASVAVPATGGGRAIGAVLVGAAAVVSLALAWRFTGSTDMTDDVVGRRIVAVASLVLLCSAVALDSFLAFDRPVLEALPDGYLAAVPTLQTLFLASSVGTLVLAARQLRVVHALAAVVTAATGWTMVSSSLGWLGWAAFAAVGLTAAAVVVGDRGNVTGRKPAIVGVLSAIAFPIAMVAGFWCAGLPVGLAALELNGGQVGVDGLPLFAMGPFAALLPAVFALAPSVLLRPQADARPQPVIARPAHPLAGL